jgi:hypothetical protein
MLPKIPLEAPSQSLRNRSEIATMDALLSSFMACLTGVKLFRSDLDYDLVRASMVIVFLFFGYQKWFDYEAKVLIPYISNGPLIFWMYPAFGIRGASWFLGVSEWTICALPFLGYWNKLIGILGAARLRRHVHIDRDHHTLHAGRLGRIRRRFSRDGRQRSLPYEGRGTLGRVAPPVETGCDEIGCPRSSRQSSRAIAIIDMS